MEPPVFDEFTRVVRREIEFLASAKNQKDVPNHANPMQVISALYYQIVEISKTSKNCNVLRRCIACMELQIDFSSALNGMSSGPLELITLAKAIIAARIATVVDRIENMPVAD